MKLEWKVLLAVVLLGSSSAFGRTWTDLQGNAMEAEFVRVHNGEIVLTRGGRVLKFPFYQFSVEDQDFVRGQLEAEGKTHLIPEPPAVEAAPNMPESMPPAQEAMQPAPGATVGPYGAAPGSTQTGGMMSQPSSSPTTSPAMGSYGAAPANSMDSMSSMSPQPMQPYSPPMETYTPPMASSMPDASASRGYIPPSSTPPSYSPPSMTPVSQKVCDSRNKVVPDSSTAGGKCPHCGVYWDYDETTGKKAPGAGRYGTFGGIAGIVLAVVGIIVRLAIRASRN